MGRNYTDVKGSKNPNYKTGMFSKGSKYKGLGNTWNGLKQRCNNPRNPKYKRYGGRGINVCEEWLDPKCFFEWALSNGWKKGMCIDRIDNDGDYCPENCQFLSVSENSRKKRTTKISFEQAKEIRIRVSNGECEHNLANEYGVVHGTIWFIVNNFTHVADGECSKALKARKDNNG